MFESAEVGNKISKAIYAREEPKLRTALLKAQKLLAETPLSVVVIFGGVEGAGRSETVNRLLGWMDARGIEVHAMWDPTDEERQRPPMWSFWRVLPPKGRTGFFFGSWYTAPIIDRVFRRSGSAEFDRELDRIVDFERMLHNEDTLVLKFWLHLSKDAQRERLKALEADPEQSWRVTKRDWKFFAKYDKFRRVDERALERTNTAEAPWHIVEGTDRRYRELTVAKTLLKALQERVDAVRRRPAPKRQPDRPRPAKVNIISRLDQSLKLSDPDYEKQFAKQAGRINRLARKLREKGRSMILVFEGADAAGKGGAIRRVTSCLDARMYQVISFAAPTEEERSHPYLWRFWRPLPRLGRITVFDRSWYGRVLVERIEGFCAPEDWRRAYGEINAFESQLAESGVIVLKFWLAITPEEQLRRFKDRETTPYKQYKLTEEDWRNREKWDAYAAAACDMIEKTSGRQAPWVPIEGNDKNHARIKILKTISKALKRAL